MTCSNDQDDTRHLLPTLTGPMLPSRRQFLVTAGAGLITAAHMATSAPALAASAATQAARHVPNTPLREGFNFAYLSDAHLYAEAVNPRFAAALRSAVARINALRPAPDFVVFGGDLAQMGEAQELALGQEILAELHMPVHMVAGEHDWYLDMGERWSQMFGPANYTFEHKGVRFIALFSVASKDFWRDRSITAKERMHTVAALGHALQAPFEVGAQGRAWLAATLAHVPLSTPVVVLTHAPLYAYYPPWNFTTADAPLVQAMLLPYANVTVLHGHTHQALDHRIGNMAFHGMLSTAWPWPTPPSQNRRTARDGRNRTDPRRGCGFGQVVVGPQASAQPMDGLWTPNPVAVHHTWL